MIAEIVLITFTLALTLGMARLITGTLYQVFAVPFIRDNA